MTGYVYAVRCGDFVKIGWSLDPMKRWTKINSDNPMPTQLLGFREGTKDDERELHRALVAHRSHAEWFHYRDTVIEITDALPNRPADIRRYVSGRKQHRDHQASFLSRFAKRHGDISRWARELGIPPSRLSSWRRVPEHLVSAVASVVGIDPSELNHASGALK